eukprot:scpid90317/ scgid21407/ 
MSANFKFLTDVQWVVNEAHIYFEVYSEKRVLISFMSPFQTSCELNIERITTRIRNVFQETEEIDVPEFMRIINKINVSIYIRLSDIELVESPPMKLKAVPTSIRKGQRRDEHHQRGRRWHLHIA